MASTGAFWPEEVTEMGWCFQRPWKQQAGPDAAAAATAKGRPESPAFL